MNDMCSLMLDFLTEDQSVMLCSLWCHKAASVYVLMVWRLTSSLIVSLFQPRSEPFGSQRTEHTAEVTGPLDLWLTQPRRLGKRVGKQPSHERLSDEVSDNRHGQRRTSADIRGHGPSQATRAAALAVPTGTWVRDEEANAGRVGVADGSLRRIHGPSRWAYER
jgi:hypothetical protein